MVKGSWVHVVTNGLEMWESIRADAAEVTLDGKKGKNLTGSVRKVVMWSDLYHSRFRSSSCRQVLLPDRTLTI